MTITPLVVKNRSSYETKAITYATTTNFTRASHSNLAYWQTYKVPGFNQHCRDNDYKMVGWDISVTGTYLVANEGTVIPADKLRTMEYTLGDNKPQTQTISYFTNRSQTFSWKAYSPDEITDFSVVVESKFSSKITYLNGLNNSVKKINDSVKVSMNYWPTYKN